MKPLDLISIATIRETVRAIDPDDDDLLLGMIEGSTDAGELPTNEGQLLKQDDERYRRDL